jgi:hypothetical protein
MLGVLGEHREAFRVALRAVGSDEPAAAAEPAVGELCVCLASHGRVQASVAATPGERRY